MLLSQTQALNLKVTNNSSQRLRFKTDLEANCISLIVKLHSLYQITSDKDTAELQVNSRELGV